MVVDNSFAGLQEKEEGAEVRRNYAATKQQVQGRARTWGPRRTAVRTSRGSTSGKQSVDKGVVLRSRRDKPIFPRGGKEVSTVSTVSFFSERARHLL